MSDPIRDRVDENLKHLTSAVERKGAAMSETKPVAYFVEYQFAYREWRETATLSEPTHVDGYPVRNIRPLYPASALTSLMEENERLKHDLADADALIKAQQHDFAANNIRNAEDAARAQAAEQEIERLLLFGGRMANACYNVGQKPKPSHMDMVDLLFAQGEWDNAAKVSRAFVKEAGE
jgi:hypothetical protein